MPNGRTTRRTPRLAPRHVFMLLFALCGPSVAGPWSRHGIDNSFLGADGARAERGHFDHRAEFAVAWEQSGLTTLHSSPLAVGLVACPWDFVVVGATPNAEDAVAVDVDGDGDRDVVVCMEGAQRCAAVFINKVDAFERYTFDLEPYKWMIVEPADLDGDGRVDLLVGGRFIEPNGQGRLMWLRPGQDPSILAAWTSQTLSDVGWPMALLTLDMDGDGDLDVVVADRYGAARGLHWLENPGAAPPATAWNRRPIGLTSKRVKGVATADLDGDGGIDFVASYEGAGSQPSGLSVLRQSSQGWTATPIPMPPGVGEPKNVAIADFDGDGLPDAAISCEAAYGHLSGIYLLLRRPGGGWEPVDVSGPDGCKFDVLTASDFDGDGDLDLMTTEEGDNGEFEALGVVWYENPFINPPPGVDSVVALWPEACEEIPEPALIELARRLRTASFTPPSQR